MIKKKLRTFSCRKCKNVFTHEDAVKVCSNCFACTGCEVYICPACGFENVFKEMKKANFN